MRPARGHGGRPSVLHFQLQVARGTTQTTRARIPRRLTASALFALALSIVFTAVLPTWALLRYDLIAAAAVIQAATSWLAAVLAIAASGVALLAYRNSIERADLALEVINSLSVVTLTLRNNGSATADQPSVVVRFAVPPEFTGLEPARAAGWDGRDFAGDGFYSTFVCTPAVAIHPGFAYECPPLLFPDRPPAIPPGQPWVVRLSVTWSSTAAHLKTEHVHVQLPSAR
jgi:hypothetical protein